MANLRKAKVDEPVLAVAFDDHVVVLDIAMFHPSLVN